VSVVGGAFGNREEKSRGVAKEGKKERPVLCGGKKRWSTTTVTGGGKRDLESSVLVIYPGRRREKWATAGVGNSGTQKSDPEGHAS